MRRALFAVVLLLSSCGDNHNDTPPEEDGLPPTDQAALLTTIEALANLGQKQAGTPAGQQAAAYIRGRYQAMGLSDIRMEAFSFPRWELTSSSLAVSIAGVPSAPGFDVFESSGGGDVVDAEVVDVGTAADLTGINLTGKIAMVVRDPSFHRAAQYRNVVAAGAAAMLYKSIAPDNLRQVGSVRYDWEANGAIPAITLGETDADAILAALTANQDVRATLEVAVRSVPSTGTNVIGVIPGERPEQIVIGAHFDTWFEGSTDNCGGVAELLAVAERRIRRGRSQYTIVVVAFDGEELALYGGYDFLRKHRVLNQDPILAVINFESPAAHDADLAGLVHSNQPAIDAALQAAHLRQLYGVYAGLEVVAQLFGGIIPTDIQGIYRSGVPTVTTAVTNPYYHTSEDTPDKVDLALLAESSDAFEEAIELMMRLAPADFAVPDPEVWTAEVTTATAAQFVVSATIKDGSGALRPGVTATAQVLYDDFTLAATLSAMTDASGVARFAFPANVPTMGSGKRFVHVGAGPLYPLVEKVIALP